MEEWKTYKLKDLILKVIDNRGKSAPVSTDMYQPLIEINALGGYSPNYSQVKKYVSKKTYDNWFRSGHPQIGDILIPTVGTIGIVSIMTENKGCIAQNVIGLRVKDFVCPEYIFYFLKSERVKKEMLNLNIGGVQPSIKVPHLMNMDIFLPPLEKQSQIAYILRSLDEKIELNNRINHNLEEQAQALYKSWFVDFEPFKDGKFVDSKFGMIPEGWKVGQLSEICEIVGGGTPSRAKAEFYTDNGIHWLTPKDLSISYMKFTSKGQDDITELGYKNCSAKLMPKGTVLFSSRAPIGYITIAKNPICTNQGFKSAVPGIAGTAFLYYYLKFNTENIENLSSGSTFKEASGSLMKALAVAIPPKDVFDEFEEVMAGYFASQENLESENSHHEAVRDSLLPRLMSGEILC